ncbi:hypothetical protein F5Y16DRAFT_325067 [Xylariaceae sp. FL0255]|nr:hypothetical protein F5Y16DRAFT_325067 [Xylariaceae sp. FL0255]
MVSSGLFTLQAIRIKPAKERIEAFLAGVTGLASSDINVEFEVFELSPCFMGRDRRTLHKDETLGEPGWWPRNRTDAGESHGVLANGKQTLALGFRIAIPKYYGLTRTRRDFFHEGLSLRIFPKDSEFEERFRHLAYVLSVPAIEEETIWFPPTTVYHRDGNIYTPSQDGCFSFTPAKDQIYQSLITLFESQDDRYFLLSRTAAIFFQDALNDMLTIKSHTWTPYLYKSMVRIKNRFEKSAQGFADGIGEKDKIAFFYSFEYDTKPFPDSEDVATRFSNAVRDLKMKDIFGFKAVDEEWYDMVGWEFINKGSRKPLKEPQKATQVHPKYVFGKMDAGWGFIFRPFQLSSNQGSSAIQNRAQVKDEFRPDETSSPSLNQQVGTIDTSYQNAVPSSTGRKRRLPKDKPDKETLEPPDSKRSKTKN